MKTITEILKEDLEEYIGYGLVKVTETNEEISVSVKTPSEFNDVYDDREKGMWYMGKGHQKSVKTLLKSMGFSFDGSGTHKLQKKTHDSDRILIPKEQLMSGDYRGMIFMKSFVDNHSDDNGMVDLVKVLKMVKEMKEDWIHNYDELIRVSS